MTKPKAKQSGKVETEFDEVVARLLQTDPKELTDALEKVRARGDEIRRNVEDSRDKINRGARLSKHRFRI